MSNPFAFAAKSKGLRVACRRLITIVRRYGFTAEKMNRTLMQFVGLLEQYGVRPAFPITGIVLMRHPTIARRMHQAGVELAAHGWTHVSFVKLSTAEQADFITRTHETFADADIPLMGFRSPYLSRNEKLPSILQDTGFSYVSNQPILWPVVEKSVYPSANWASYQQAVTFYAPWSPQERVPTPHMIGSLVELPVSLPDDEMLLDRLGLIDSGLLEDTWGAILARTYQQEGLFTLQLHPERFHLCVNGLAAVLRTAQDLSPPVWIARLSEIADWWRARTAAKVVISSTGRNGWEFQVTGPAGIVWLLRGVTTKQDYASPWVEDYHIVTTSKLKVRAKVKPIIGVSLQASSSLLSFLQQQGYLIEKSDTPENYGIYLTQDEFDPAQEQSLLAQIEQSGQPAVKLGRWPNGARSAMAVTGDIDALTVWDYIWRLFGR